MQIAPSLRSQHFKFAEFLLALVVEVFPRRERDGVDQLAHSKRLSRLERRSRTKVKHITGAAAVTAAVATSSRQERERRRVIRLGRPAPDERRVLREDWR
jgi:hypothetical protein